MARETRIMAGLVLTFDNYTDMELITKEVGLDPTRVRNKRDARRNPFYGREDVPDDWSGGEYLEGSWDLYTNYICTLDLRDVSAVLLEKIKPRVDTIKVVLEKYDGKAGFYVVPEIARNNIPSLLFDEDFIKIAAALKAPIEVDMYF